MPAIVGTALVAASFLCFAWATIAFRDPAGPAWREKYLVLESIACVIVGLFAFGLALQLQFAFGFPSPTRWALVAVVFVLLPAIHLLAWRGMGVSAKVAKFDAAEAAAEPRPAEPAPAPRPGVVESLRKTA